MLPTQNMFNLVNMFNNNLMKGKFVETLKQLSDLELFELFFQSQRLCLKTKGLAGQLLKMDVSMQVPGIDESEAPHTQ